MRSSLLSGVAVALALFSTGPAMGQDVDPPAVAELEAVIVTARRAGAPMWTVERGDSTVILVGTITDVPRGFEWRPEALEAATARADRVLYPIQAEASPADLVRMLWRIRTIVFLPSGRTLADYASPSLVERIARLKADDPGDPWRHQTPMGLSLELMREAGRERRGPDARAVVRDSARKARVPGDPVGVLRGDELVDNMISLPPETYLPCLEAAVGAAEAGPAAAQARLEAWRGLRVVEVMENPLDQAMNLCWPTGDPDVAPLLRTRWAEATRHALVQPGVTLAVAPLRVLAEPGGVLDQLEAEGLEPSGPIWRRDQAD